MIGAFQEVDVHGMNRTQAFAAIDAKLRRAGGTVLRDAIRAHYRSNPKVLRIELGLNQGETDLILREI